MAQDEKRGDRRGSGSAARELHLVRMFEAPRSLVWRAWTDGALVARWWGPRMFDAPVCEVDARPGGAIRIHMRGPDGTIFPMTGVFHEVVEPERLVFTACALLALDADPVLETRNVVTLENAGGRTKMTVDIVVVKATPEAEGPLAGMEQGWNEQLDRLVEAVVALTGPAKGSGKER